jgi:hypothetical protein
LLSNAERTTCACRILAASVSSPTVAAARASAISVTSSMIIDCRRLVRHLTPQGR